MAILLLVTGEEGFEEDGGMTGDVHVLHVDSVVLVDRLASHKEYCPVNDVCV